MRLGKQALLYFHTIRHLRLSQLASRVVFRLKQLPPEPKPAPVQRALTRHWVGGCERSATMLDEDTLVFLNEARTLHDATLWNDPSVDKLWLYNLHYFDDLNAKGAIQRSAWHDRLIARWINENPPGSGNGWEPYPCSLRIVNWVKWALNGGKLAPRALDSLATQARHLHSRLEYHLLGNHLLANAKALVFAGAFFEDDEANRWLAKGMAILRRELPEQILPDGGHFELSPMYHAIILEDLLDIANLSSVYGLGRIVPAGYIDRMRSWFALMCHPDGDISFFNDAAFGIAPDRRQLDEYAGRLQYPPVVTPSDGVHLLADSGYARLQEQAAVLIVDAAEVGPSYLPGHAHADSLSFELSLWGQRVMVNSGISCYGSSQERQRQRGTAAHNTLVLDGEDSSEVWSGFRVARRANVQVLGMDRSPAGIRLAARHDGYRRLPGHNGHQRSWLLAGDALEIEDEVSGAFSQAEVFFHLHPDMAVDGAETGDGRVSLRLPGGQQVSISFAGGEARSEPGSWHPGFGEAVPNTCLVVRLHGARLSTVIRWGLSR